MAALSGTGRHGVRGLDTLSRLEKQSQMPGPRLWFGGEGSGDDPRAQTEDLSDNAVVAGEYGIKNLKRILANLPAWTKEEADVRLKELRKEFINMGKQNLIRITTEYGEADCLCEAGAFEFDMPPLKLDS